MRNLNKQRGTAIIVALFVVALVAAAAIAMIDRLRIDMRRTELLLNNTRANFYAEGSIAWAKDQLVNDWKLQQTGRIIDHTPIQSPVNDANDAKVFSIIYDAQANFNINTLSNTQSQTAFIRLLLLLKPDLNTDQAKNLMQNIISWTTPGGNNNKLDDYYGKLHPPYRAPHAPILSISELRMVKDMTPQLFALLAPNITALPADALQINVNNAPPTVLMSLSPSMSLDGAKTIEAHRQQTPFPTTQDFLNFDIVKNNPITDNSKITVASSYFLVETHVTIGDQHIVLYTLLQRLLKNAQPVVITLWQSKGTL